MLKNVFPQKKGRHKKQTEGPSFSIQTSLFWNASNGRKFRKRKKKVINLYLNKYLSFLWDIRKSSFLLGSILAFVALALFIILGPVFGVKTIYITREDNIININSAYNSVEYIRGDNILFLDTWEIAQRLLKQQKSIQNIEFQVDFPSTLNINLRSYPALFQTEKYLVLSNGVIVIKEDNRIVEVPELLVSKDLSEFSLFWKTLNIKEIRNISLLTKELSRNIPGFKASKLKYYITEKELLVSTPNESIFIFDLNANIKNQVQKLAIFQKEKEDFAQKKYIYLDVRVPQRLFLCRYEEEFSCRNNLKKIYGEDIFTEMASLLEEEIDN